MVSVKPNASSISACHGVSGPNAWPGAGLPLGVQRHQLAGDLPHRSARLGLGVGPVAAAQPAQRRRLAADIARQLIQRIHWHIELVGLALPRLLDAYSSTRYSRRAPPTVRSVISTNRPMPCWSCTTRSPAVSASGSTVLRRLAASRLPSVAVTRLPVRSVSVTITRLAPGNHHAVVQRALEHADDPGLGRRSRLQHRCRGVGFGQLLDDPMRGSGPGRDDGGVPAGRHVRAQHREDFVDIALVAAGRRRRPDVQFDRRFVGQLAQRPPRVPGLARGGTHLVEFAEARSAELLDVDGRIAAHAATDQDASRNSRPVLIRSAARVRTFSGSQTSTGVPSAS